MSGSSGVWRLEPDGSSSSCRYSTGWQQRCEHKYLPGQHSVHGSSEWSAATVSGSSGAWSQTAAVAAVGTVLGSSRGANTSTFCMPHLTFYTLAYVQLPNTHTHARSFSFVSHIPVGMCFVQTCTNPHGCVVSTEHVERSGVTGLHKSCTGFLHTG